MLFVCYSSLDERAVLSMVGDLRNTHYEVWIDEKLHGGQPWWQEILKQIRDCEVFVLALSDNAVKSKPCGAELSYARKLGLPVLPVQIGPVEHPHTLPVADLQIVDYRSRELTAQLELISSVNASAMRRQALPATLPPDPPVPYAFLAGIATDLGAAELSYQQQAEIIDRLEAGLDEEDSTVRPEILGLLDILSARRDLYFKHAERIAAIRRAATAPGPPSEEPSERKDEAHAPPDSSAGHEVPAGFRHRRVAWISAGAAVLVILAAAAVLWIRLPADGSTEQPTQQPTEQPTQPTEQPTATVPPLTTSDGLIPQSDAIPDATLAIARRVGEVSDIFLIDSESGELGTQVTRGGSPVAEEHDPPWPSISPDRRSIVYIVQTSDASSYLRVVAADGSGDRELFDERICDRYLPPAWDPVRQDRLALACLVDGHFALRLVNLDGSVLTEFPINNAWVDDVSFSPDGSSIAYFSGTRGDPGGSIFTIRVDGPFQPVNLTGSTLDRHPVWNEDGSEIAFERGDPAGKQRRIHVMAADGSDLRAIGPSGSDNIEPTWSPDGTSIAFRSNSGTGDGDLYRYWVMDSTGENIRPLAAADTAPAAAYPAWGRR
ncbi:TIR domain-containing protein [Micromonospora sp. DT81.3]|uniref:TIR domain-containing protein n=1 Tax=Micromonospora sp. DT81.3 TaxID=3416523 RepID=UPI003CF95529